MWKFEKLKEYDFGHILDCCELWGRSKTLKLENISKKLMLLGGYYKLMLDMIIFAYNVTILLCFDMK